MDTSARPVPSREAPRARSRGGGSVLRAAGVTQAALLAACAARLAAGEVGGRLVDLLSRPERRPERRARRRARGLRRVARTLGRLKGAFAKAGQFAALRYDVLPGDVREAFAELQDRVPPIPFAKVRALVESELGGPLEAHFEAFEESPLGAASIAQVHRARLRGGGDVAVKVQYPWLRSSLRADLALARWLVRLATGRGSAAVDRARLLDEFASGLREELDFVREARVASEIAANLAGDDRIVVPRVHPSHSSERVLTLDFHTGIPVGDREALRRAGIAPRDVLEVLARAYARQIFVDGLFHADPHPGNLFVLDEPEAARRPRVLFVDFGLSRRLDPELRRALRKGIYALLQRDLEAFVVEMDHMGMIAPGAEPGVRRAVGSMFARIASEASNPLALGGGQVLGLKDEAKGLLASTPGLQLPNDLLLYAKTLSYLFALGDQLDPDADLVKLCTPSLLRFLAG